MSIKVRKDAMHAYKNGVKTPIGIVASASEDVRKWLDEHPEVAFSVKDHSLTIDKMVLGTLGYVTPEMFGAVGDGISDDTVALQNAFDYGATNNITVILCKEYLVSIQSSNGIDTTNAAKLPCALKINTNQKIEFLNSSSIKLKKHYGGYYYFIMLCADVQNVSISGNGYVIGDRYIRTDDTGELGHGIGILGCNNITVDDLTIEKCWGDGIYLNCSDLVKSTDVPQNISMINLTCDRNRRNGIAVIAGNNVLIDSCKCNNTDGTNPMAGIDIEAAYYEPDLTNIRVVNSEMIGNTKSGFGCNLKKNGSTVIFKNCISTSNFESYFMGTNCSAIIDGCTIGKEGKDQNGNDAVRGFVKMGYEDTNVNGSSFIIKDSLIVGQKKACAFRLFTKPNSNINIERCTFDMSDYDNASVSGTIDSVFLTNDSIIYNLNIDDIIIKNGKLSNVLYNTSSENISSINTSINVKMLNVITEIERNLLSVKDNSGFVSLERNNSHECTIANELICGQYNNYTVADSTASVTVRWLSSGQKIRITNTHTTALPVNISIEKGYDANVDKDVSVYSLRAGEAVDIYYDKEKNKTIVEQALTGMVKKTAYVVNGGSFIYPLRGDSAIILLARVDAFGLYVVTKSPFVEVVPLIPTSKVDISYDASNGLVTINNVGDRGYTVTFIL